MHPTSILYFCTFADQVGTQWWREVVKSCWSILSVWSLGVVLLLSSHRCTEPPAPEERGNRRPETFLAVDSVRTEQSSQVHVYWYGDDPDGLVIGFLFSWDFRHWYFTRRNDSLFQLRLRRPDSTFRFAVAAVDNSVVWEPPADTSMPIPFDDRSGNGRWDPPEEEFRGLEGAVDLSPAVVEYRVVNTPPQIFWGPDSTPAAAALMRLPDTTFPVATFVFAAYDFDGNETLAAIEWSLNDSSEVAEWHRIPPTQTMLTLRASDGLHLNAPNVLYIRAVDRGGLRSAVLQYPPPDGVWYVKQPSGPILIVEDSFDKRSHQFYQAALDTIAGGRYAGRYEFLNIRERGSDGWYRNLPRLLTPMFVETLKLFDVVLWYGDIGLSLDIPQTVLPGYLAAGGKLIFSAPLPNLPTLEDRQKILDFAPLDSLSAQELFSSPTVFRPGDTLMRTEQALQQYPRLVKGSGNVVGIHRLFPTAAARSLYLLPPKSDYEGTPPVVIQSTVDQQFFLNIPLSAFQRNGGAARLLEHILVEEFQVP